MLEAFGTSHQGSVRQNNEDYFLVLPELGLYLVADGMGGAQAGEHASRLACEVVAGAVRAADRREPESLQRAVLEANRAVQEAAAGNPGLEGMGTTLVAALETGRGLCLASVGDSRAYLFEDGALRLVTNDQTWVEEVGRPLGLQEAELRTHPMRHVLTMAIGASIPLKVHEYALSPRSGSQVLLSTDGLHGVVGRETIAEALSSGQTLEAKCHFLIDAAIRAGGPDNITTVLLRVL
jgi:PPM family protein phosphatase